MANASIKSGAPLTTPIGVCEIFYNFVMVVVDSLENGLPESGRGRTFERSSHGFQSIGKT